jgi:hypothetical protein
MLSTGVASTLSEEVLRGATSDAESQHHCVINDQLAYPMRGSWRCSRHAPRSSVCAKGMVWRPQPLPVASTASWRTAARNFGAHIRPSGVGIHCTACRENKRSEQNCSHQPT